jgi:23S rRNA pseudouridine1911/1915/1917 synthase
MSSQTPPETSPDTTPIRATAGQQHDGMRADRFLAEAQGELSRSRLKQFIEEGRVTRDGQVLTQPAEAVKAGSVYTLTLPPPAPARPQPQHIPFPILFEDADLIVLDKPAGLVVHPAPGNEDGTLVNALLAHCGDALPGIGGEKRPGIVHRLDKDTSGVMVVAKSEMALKALQDMFVERYDLERAYLALAWGLLNPAEGEFSGAIGRDKNERKRMAVVSHGGKQALTHYRTLATAHAAVSLIECRLATGRTHQIRVHLSHAGHPIVGDPVYLRRIPAVARALPQELRETLLDFPRQALHAATLGFRHPRNHHMLRFTSPLPEDFAGLLRALGIPETVAGS